MVSTRQSSNIASSGDSYVPAGSSSLEAIHSTPHTGGKLLRSGLSAPPPTHLPCSSNSELVLVNGASSTITQQPSTLNLLDLPHEILDKIFGFLGYKNVAHLRPVCRQLDRVCQAILNSTFQRLQHQMLHRFQSIKAKMPRRESARRNHPLACESDIIETLHMRLTLLQMTFGKHIERKHCCFFAGEILDEVNRILHYIKVTSKLARPYKVTDELFDLSTMAMEFFKEHIEPTLPEIAYFGTDFIDFSFPGSSPSSKYFTLDSPPHGSKGYESPTSGNEASSIDPQPVPQSNMVLRKRIRKIKQGMKRYNNQLTVMRRDLRTCKSKIAEQQKQILEYASRMDEYDKKNEETSRKFSTLLQELNKCKTELQYWRSKTPAIPSTYNNCGHIGFAPTVSEEVQSPNRIEVFGFGLGTEHTLPLEPIELRNEAGTSKDEDFWKFYGQKKDEKSQNRVPVFLEMKSLECPMLSPRGNSSSSTTTSATTTTVTATKTKDEKDKMSPVRYSPLSSKTSRSKNLKRKIEEDCSDSCNKKPKRVLKVRCASKRVKT
ncbi:hypothetical protein RUM43_000664 [Polyplax serrata]|uniref:F-box domain-containing protein n=1 Tax=Polyplax serrata TaxID=468196 RepID=A0AAN8XSM7_POLSC